MSFFKKKSKEVDKTLYEVTINPETNQLEGIPPSWKKALKDSKLSKDELAENPRVLYNCLCFAQRGNKVKLIKPSSDDEEDSSHASASGALDMEESTASDTANEADTEAESSTSSNLASNSIETGEQEPSPEIEITIETEKENKGTQGETIEPEGDTTTPEETTNTPSESTDIQIVVPEIVTTPEGEETQEGQEETGEVEEGASLEGQEKDKTQEKEVVKEVEEQSKGKEESTPEINVVQEKATELDSKTEPQEKKVPEEEEEEKEDGFFKKLFRKKKKKKTSDVDKTSTAGIVIGAQHPPLEVDYTAEYTASGQLKTPDAKDKGKGKALSNVNSNSNSNVSTTKSNTAGSSASPKPVRAGTGGLLTAQNLTTTRGRQRSSSLFEETPKRRGRSATISRFQKKDPTPPPTEEEMKKKDKEETQRAKYEEEVLPYIQEGNPKKLFTDLGRIGKGGFGEVYIATSQLEENKGDTVALKQMEYKSARDLKYIVNEIKTLSSMEHPNLIRYIGSWKGKGQKIWMVMQYMDGGTLQDLSRGYNMSEGTIAVVIKEVLQGIAFMHSIGRIHRDIKSANVLLSLKGDVRLCDFGLCAPVTETETTSMVGSPYWMSPEVIAKKPYGKGIDIWAVGILAIEMAEENPPYYEFGPLKALYMIATHGVNSYFEDKNDYSVEFRDFLTQCLHPDPTERPSAEELLSHPLMEKTTSRKKLVQALDFVFVQKSLSMTGL
eukprot:TRINITY_DN1718_c0_g3_i2.p1 TRINITY_DN1718_c0_g3~~TRINITY_DN1718_c0_g3_i2.p1  ORF type:complete len:725 (-),score=254.97 TRINITY_DN1718_c0_g3_i2:83-2257(-)